MRRPSSQFTATTNDLTPPEGEAQLSKVALALARQAAREAFGAAPPRLPPGE